MSSLSPKIVCVGKWKGEELNSDLETSDDTSRNLDSSHIQYRRLHKLQETPSKERCTLTKKGRV